MARRLSNVDGAVTGGYTGGYIPGVVGHPAYYNMQGGLQPHRLVFLMEMDAGGPNLIAEHRKIRQDTPAYLGTIFCINLYNF